LEFEKFDIIRYIQEIGFFNTIILLIIILIIYLIVKYFSKYLDKFLYFKQNKQKIAEEEHKKLIEKEKLEIQKLMLDEIKMAMRTFSEASYFMRITAEKLQISVEKDKYIILANSYVGKDECYMVKLKRRIMIFFESNKNYSEFKNVKEELVPLYYDTVFPRLNKFIFQSPRDYEILKDKSRNTIMDFLDTIEEYAMSNNFGGAEAYMKGKFGLLHVATELVNHLINYYNVVIESKYDISYLEKSIK